MIKAQDVSPTTLGKIAILYGGLSKEREISLISGNAVYKSLSEAGYDATLVDADASVAQKLIAGNFDRVFIALHGGAGEDGTIQGLLESLNLPYTGSGVLGCAITLDKYLTKLLWRSLELPTPRFLLLENTQAPLAAITDFNYPLAVKANLEGSSIGVYKALNEAQFLDAVVQASKLGQVLIEQWIDGEEYSVPIVNNQALPAIHITTPSGFYDYNAKYFTKTTTYNIPCGLDKPEEEKLQQLALKAFFAADCQDWGRVDFMRDKLGNFYLLEVNTVPGLTPTSLVPKAMANLGYTFLDLLINLLSSTNETTQTRQAQKSI